MIKDEGLIFQERARLARVMVEEIMAQREEILKAFIAKYGFDPDEAVQVEERTENGIRWYIRKKEKAV